MTNTERLLLRTLPRWSGVTVSSIGEKLSDMWLRGEKAGHHGGLAYNPDGIDRLIFEIRRDFKKTPPATAFGSGAIVTIADLDDAMQGVAQKPMTTAAVLVASFAPVERAKLVKHAKSRRSRLRTKREEE